MWRNGLQILVATMPTSYHQSNNFDIKNKELIENNVNSSTKGIMHWCVQI